MVGSGEAPGQPFAHQYGEPRHLNAGVLLRLTTRLFGFLFLLAAGSEVFEAKRGSAEERNHRQDDHA